MDYGAFPPEFNSARIHGGPGSAPLRAAAAAWEALADDLYATAGSYSSVVADLTGEQWRGRGATAMATAATRYVTWLTATAEHAERAGAQAGAAAGACETALAATVPPPMIEANRAQWAALATSNPLAQRAPAIADTEAHYDGMWAQDAAALYRYARESATAAALSAFVAPPQPAEQVGRAGDAQAVLTPLIGMLPSAIDSLSSASPASPRSSLDTLDLAAAAEQFPAYPANALVCSVEGGDSQPAATGTARLGWAGAVGRLSVPQVWAAQLTHAAASLSVPQRRVTRAAGAHAPSRAAMPAVRHFRYG